MQIKVEIKYSLWPYEETIAVTIPTDEFDKLDSYVDSITSNLKMQILGRVRKQHPSIWYKDTTLNIEQLKQLTNVDADKENIV